MNSENLFKKILDKIEVLDSKIENLDSKIESMDSRIENIEGQSYENTSILRTLEHTSEIHKAEIDILNIQVAKIIGNEEKVKKLEDSFKNHTHDIVISSNEANVI